MYFPPVRLPCVILHTSPTPAFLSLRATGRLTDAALVSFEIPLLIGLNYELAIHQPYRPLRALLTAVIAAYASLPPGATAADMRAAGGTAASDVGAVAALELADPLFVPAWDVLQARSFALVDVALTTDATLLYTPALVAAACLIAAAVPSPAPADSVHIAGWFDDDALNRAPPLAVAAFVEPLVRRTLSAESATGGSSSGGGSGSGSGSAAARHSADGNDDAARDALDDIGEMLNSALATTPAAAEDTTRAAAAWTEELDTLLERAHAAAATSQAAADAAADAAEGRAARAAYKSEKGQARQKAALQARAEGLL